MDNSNEPCIYLYRRDVRVKTERERGAYRSGNVPVVQVLLKND